MLKYTTNSTKEKSTSEMLMLKDRMIVVTNVCNLNCGGCSQLIGHFKKNQLWFIEIEDLESQIEILEKYPNKENRPITIFGGEPTLHPKWNEIISILKSHKNSIFWINTNGRAGHKRYQKEDNLVWWVDLHPSSQMFVQTLHAAADIVSLPNDLAYWEKAQKDCPLWNGCQSAIYNGKAYFCETAAAIDWLFEDGKNGWVIEKDKNPFDRSKEEIDEQAKHSCKRCGWCVSDMVARQPSNGPSHVSSFNQQAAKKYSLTVIEPIKIIPWGQKYNSNKEENISIGIWRLNKSSYANCLTGIKEYYGFGKKESIEKGKLIDEWTIFLEDNQVIPEHAMIELIDWMKMEKTRNKPRFHVSIPVYEINSNIFDIKMQKPNSIPVDVVIGFNCNSTERIDDNIFGRLGHRNHTEGYGRSSLWHDQFTDIVGGVIQIKS